MSIRITLPNVEVEDDNFIIDDKSHIQQALRMMRQIVSNALWDKSNKLKIKYRVFDKQIEMVMYESSGTSNEEVTENLFDDDMDDVIMTTVEKHLSVVDDYGTHLIEDNFDQAVALNQEYGGKPKSSYDIQARLDDDMVLVTDKKEIKVEKKQKLNHQSQTESNQYTWYSVEPDKPHIRNKNFSQFVGRSSSGAEEIADLDISTELWPQFEELMHAGNKVDIEFEVPIVTTQPKKIRGRLTSIQASQELFDDD